MLNLVANGPSGYNLSNSLRFRSSASAYLSRTPSVSSNRRTWTWSAWVKRGSLGAYQVLFGAGLNNGVNADELVSIYFTNSDQLGHYVNETGVADRNNYSTAVYRDPSAWYHIVAIYDSTQATAANRQRLFVNNVEITSWAATSYVSQNYQPSVNSNAYPHAIGKYGFNATRYFDGYMTEINFIDGQALTPSSFGSTNSTTGVWQPAKYNGSYGTNGFYLKFSNIALTSGSNTGLGQDYSGNGNYWNTNNISVTSGTTYDAMTDVPTLTSATVANYCTLNPIGAVFGTPTFSNANLTVTATAGNDRAIGTIFVSSGKWYWEATAGTVGSTSNVSVASDTIGGYAAAYRASGGTLNLTGSPTFNSYTSGDIIGVALDIDSGTVAFYKNGVQQGTGFYTYTASSLNMYGHLTYFSATGTGNSFNLNFGQRPFSYTPPTGYVALNTYNLPTSTIVQGNKYMDATLYTGTGSALNVTNTASFKPDFVWIKSRSAAYNHGLFDSVRGALKVIQSQSTAAEVTESAGTSLTGFNSNGFALGTNGGTVSTNVNGATFVGWQWQAGQGSTSSNTSGSITSTVSVNASAGFSVATWTAPGSGSFTVGHGLGVAPKFIITKVRNTADNWLIWHTSIGSSGYLLFNTNASATNSTIYNGLPTSTLINYGSYLPSNGSTYVTYSWAEIAGFSKFGSYTGNGSTDGPFVYLGFRPKFVMVKEYTQAGDYWMILDTSRDTYNIASAQIYPNASSAESSTGTLDMLSNGFKLRYTGGYGNNSGQSYIYAAFAENPFKNALAR